MKCYTAVWDLSTCESWTAEVVYLKIYLGYPRPERAG